MADTGSSLLFESLYFRNFLSFGNYDTRIDLSRSSLTVIMGENFDTGGEDSRNGAGKSSVLDALCYALFGKTSRGLSASKLINKLARKSQTMLVELCFRKGDQQYLISRSENPSKLHLLGKPIDSDEDFWTKSGRALKFDLSRNKKDTNQQIIDLIGFDIVLFEYLVGNSSEVTPFVKLPEDKRRDVMERLLGFTILSQKADRLTEKRRDTNRILNEKRTKLEADKAANTRVQTEINRIKHLSGGWEVEHDRALRGYEKKIEYLVGKAEEIVRKNDERQERFDDTLKIFNQNPYVVETGYSVQEDWPKLSVKMEQHHTDLQRMRSDLARSNNQLNTIRSGIESRNRTSQTLYESAQRELKLLKDENDRLIIETNTLQEDAELLDQKREKITKSDLEGSCPTCGQPWIGHAKSARDAELMQIDTQISRVMNRLEQIETRQKQIIDRMDQIDSTPPVLESLETSEILELSNEIENQKNIIETKESLTEQINSVKLLLSHLNGSILEESILMEQFSQAEKDLEQAEAALQEEQKAENPYREQIESLEKNALIPVDQLQREVDTLDQESTHMTFLIELLTRKDSFVRKLIIDRWLPRLNSRINYYLGELELPHTIRFDQEMNLLITLNKAEYDYGNLSKGERTRTVGALNFAFQDIYEYMNNRINLLFVDELIDSGICNRGADNFLRLINEKVQKNQKKTFLITHRQDISDQVEDVMVIRKEHDISTIIH